MREIGGGQYKFVKQIMMGLCSLFVIPVVGSADEGLAVVEISRLAYEQVRTLNGTWVYSLSHPGRDQKIRDMIQDYEPAKYDYFPDIGPDTLALAFDRDRGLVRLDNRESSMLHAGVAAGRRYVKWETYVWNGEDLRVLKATQMGTEAASMSGEIHKVNRIPTVRHPEFPTWIPQEDRNILDVIANDPSVVVEIRRGESETGGAPWHLSAKVAGQIREIEIDPLRGFGVTGIVYDSGTQPYENRFEITVREFDPGVWYPSSWRLEVFHKDTQELLTIHEFREVKIGVNRELPDSLFEVDFAPGLEVTDHRTQSRVKQPPGAVSDEYIERVRREFRNNEEQAWTGWLGQSWLMVAGTLVALVVVFIAKRRTRGNG